MAHSPYSALAKGFTNPDFSLESRKPKPAQPLFSPFADVIGAPLDEEKGRSVRTRSTSSFDWSPARPVASTSKLNLDSGCEEFAPTDGDADEWMDALPVSNLNLNFPAAQPVRKEQSITYRALWTKKIDAMVEDPSIDTLDLTGVPVGYVPDEVNELSAMRLISPLRTPSTSQLNFARSAMAKTHSAPPDSEFFKPTPTYPSPPPSPARQVTSPTSPPRLTGTPRKSFGRTPTSGSLFATTKPATAPPIKMMLGHTSLTTESISHELWTLSHLRVLSLRNNQLTTLPPGVGRLTDLVELELSTNKLTFLPAEITRLEKLHHLRLAGNRWMLPPASAPPTPPRVRTSTAEGQVEPALLPSAMAESQPRLLGPLQVNYEVPTLREIVLRTLLAPAPSSSAATVSESQPGSSLLPSAFVEASSTTASKTLLEKELGGGAGDFAKANTRLTEPLLSTLFPQGKWRGISFDGEPPRQAFDPKSNVCCSPAHEGQDRVFVEAAVERFEWVSEASLRTTNREGRWKSESTMSLFGGRNIPILWRGCGMHCLDWLEEEQSEEVAPGSA